MIAGRALVIAGLIGWAVYAGQSSGNRAAPPGVATGDDSGIVIGNGPVTVDVYDDFICPACQAYEAATRSTLDQLLAAKKITLVFHPVAFLDRTTSTKYSTRAASAAACAGRGRQVLRVRQGAVRQPAARGRRRAQRR